MRISFSVATAIANSSAVAARMVTAGLLAPGRPAVAASPIPRPNSPAHKASAVEFRSRSGNIAAGLIAASMDRVRMARWAFAAQAPMSSSARIGI